MHGYQKAVSKTTKGNIQGGGLCIYVKNDIQFIEKYTHFTAEVEHCAITIFGANEKIDVYNIHVIEKKIITRDNLQYLFRDLNKNSIIVGDFNLKHLI